MQENKIIGWAVEHIVDNKIDTRYVRETEVEADALLKDMKEEDLFPEKGEWVKTPVYKAA